MNRPLPLLALLGGIVLSIATSPARWGDQQDVPLGEITLSPEAPERAIEISIDAQGSFDEKWVNIVLNGENASTSSVDLVLLDTDTREEVDRVTVAGGFSDEPGSFSAVLDATPLWADEIAVTLVLEGDGPVSGILSVQVQIESFEKPEEGDELSVAVEAS